jgi:lipopolysaccharide export system protein LptA
MTKAPGFGIVTIFVILSLVIILPLTVIAQEESVVTLTADSLVGKIINGQSVREANGHVRIRQENVLITCGKAIQYYAEKRIEGIGNLRVVQDTLTLVAKQGSYYTEKRVAEFTQGARLTDGRVTLTSDSGTYRTDDKIAFFRGRVVVIDSATTIFADRLTYYRSEGKTVAIGNVKVLLREGNATVYGDSLEHYDKRRYSMITKNPKLVQLDSTVTSKIDTTTGARTQSVRIDTLVVTSRMMEVYQDSTYSVVRRDTVHSDTIRTGRRLVATDSVEIVRSELASRAGEVTYYTMDSLIVLRTKPVLWHGDTQVTGDSIAVRLANRRLSELSVKGNAFAASKSDSLHRIRFDQLTGQDLTLCFKNDKIHRIRADKNAINLYYVYDKGKANGMNRTSADTIVIFFVDGKVDYSKAIGGVEGQYYPEMMVRGREKEYDLPDFNWIEERPRKEKKLVNKDVPRTLEVRGTLDF